MCEMVLFLTHVKESPFVDFVGLLLAVVLVKFSMSWQRVSGGCLVVVVGVVGFMDQTNLLIDTTKNTVVMVSAEVSGTEKKKTGEAGNRSASRGHVLITPTTNFITHMPPLITTIQGSMSPQARTS